MIVIEPFVGVKSVVVGIEEVGPTVLVEGAADVTFDGEVSGMDVVPFVVAGGASVVVLFAAAVVDTGTGEVTSVVAAVVFVVMVVLSGGAVAVVVVVGMLVEPAVVTVGGIIVVVTNPDVVGAISVVVPVVELSPNTCENASTANR